MNGELEFLMNVLSGKDPSDAIESAEKKGQEDVCKRSLLPKKINRLSVPEDIRLMGVRSDMNYEKRNEVSEKNCLEYTKHLYEKMGISILSSYDDLFYEVSLPEGWKIIPTEHPMWNDLRDNLGRKRAQFFYKAAFYDRDSFINFVTRFSISVKHVGDPDCYEDWKNSDYKGTFNDGDEVIFETRSVAPTGDYMKDRKIESELEAEVIEYANKHYPDYKGIHSYWD